MDLDSDLGLYIYIIPFSNCSTSVEQNEEGTL